MALSDARSTGAKGVVCVVPELIRLRFSGRDRASFLHNFCTNDIKGLSIGVVMGETWATSARRTAVERSGLTKRVDTWNRSRPRDTGFNKDEAESL